MVGGGGLEPLLEVEVTGMQKGTGAPPPNAMGWMGMVSFDDEG